jgi:carboxyl-terminal processing protease
VLWGGQPAATEARAFTRKLSGITRAPFDTRATVTYRNPGDVQKDAAITATKETWSALQAESMLPSVTLDMRTILSSKTLDGGVGYIRVDLFAPNMTTPFPARAFRSALAGFVDSGAPALILDLRGTSAGLDEFAAEFAAHFLSEARPYRELEVYNDKTEAFERDPASALSVTPAEPMAPRTYLLVDGQTARAAETFAWTLQQAGAAVVVGESKTRGVTNVPDRTVKLPGGHTFTYPIGRWIAPDGTTPVEPDAVGEGGVTPDIKIPVTEESLRSSVLEKRDTALEYLQSHIARQQPQ